MPTLRYRQEFVGEMTIDSPAIFVFDGIWRNKRRASGCHDG
jgi:hypothetical protein